MADNKVNMLADFAPVSTQVWKDKIIADLKGADFDKKLVWRTPEGFNVQPFYRKQRMGYPPEHLRVQERTQGEREGAGGAEQRYHIPRFLSRQRQTDVQLHQNTAQRRLCTGSSHQLLYLRLRSAEAGEHPRALLRPYGLRHEGSYRFYQRGPDQEHAPQGQSSDA